jgi:RHS repeat-associated protein
LSVEVDGLETLSATYDAQDRVETFGDASFEQSAHGNLLRRTDANGALELEYDSLGNLLSATTTNAKATKNVTYTVDGVGRRVGKQVAGKFTRAWLYQDALRPAAEITDKGVFSQFVYAGGGGTPDFMLRGGVAFRFVKDHLGSVRFVVNATTGAVVQALDYDDFGRVVSDTAPGFQPFGFAGGLFDADTGLVRFGARDYDPTVGRWTSKDPIGFRGGLNLYAYCENNPINCVDPTGNEPIYVAEFDVAAMAASQAQAGGGQCDVDYSCRAPWYEEAIAQTSNTLNRPLNRGEIKFHRELERLAVYDRPLDNVSLDLYLLGAGSALRALRFFESGGAFVTVTSWAERGMTPDLNPGRWVQLGGATRVNFWRTGLPGPKAEIAWAWPPVRFFPSNVPFANSITGRVPRSALAWPPGLEAFKGVLGQRVLR